MKVVATACALALLLSTAALAQTDPAAPESPSAELQPPAEMPGAVIESPQPGDLEAAMPSDDPGDAADMHSGRGGEMRGRRHAERGEWRHHGRGGPHGAQHRHHRGWERKSGSAGQDRSPGARFSFNQGAGGPSIVIKCADEDSTLECANAVMPMLERFAPQPASDAASQ